MPDPQKEKRQILLVVLIALLNGIIFYQATGPYKVGKMFAATNPDTFLYAQYARAIAEGHPYQFNAGDPATTGSTSHLYPVILAFFHRIGFGDFALLEVTFWLNIFFYLISVVLLWFLASVLEPGGRRFVAVLFSLSGYAMHIFAGLSDIGLFTVLTLALWLSLLYRRHTAGALLLFLLPFARPEGAIIAVLFPTVLLYERLKSGAVAAFNRKLLVAGAGLLGAAGLVILNIALTGIIGFDSTLGKNYFSRMHLLPAVNYTVHDSLILWKNVLFGLNDAFRQYFFIPVVSGILILIGFYRFAARKVEDAIRPGVELWWLLSLLCSTLLVVSSSFLGIHYDRYLFWMMPLLTINLIRGVLALPLTNNIKTGICTVFLLFQIAAYPFFLHGSISSASKTTPLVKTVLKAGRSRAPGVRVAVLGGSGIKYLNPDWYIINLGGVTSPWFREVKGNIAGEIKTCQHRPSLQFDRFLRMPDVSLPIPEITGDSVVEEFPSRYNLPVTLYSIDWQLLLKGETPLDDSIFRQLPPNRQLIDRIDAAWTADEKRTGFKCTSAYPYTNTVQALTKGSIRGKNLADAVRPVTGDAAFTLKTLPHKKHWLVVRVAVDQPVLLNGLSGRSTATINLRKIKSLTVSIDNTFKGTIDMSDLEQLEEEHFFERVITVPPDAITGESTRFCLSGFYLLCDLWIYGER